MLIFSLSVTVVIALLLVIWGVFLVPVKSLVSSYPILDTPGNVTLLSGISFLLAIFMSTFIMFSWGI